MFSNFINGNSPKQKISSAIREVESHRVYLQNTREKLEKRRNELFQFAFNALGEKDDEKASIYGKEHSELDNMINAVNVSELSLTQINIRLENTKDMIDVVNHMELAFNTMKNIGENTSEIVPALENITEQMNSTISEILMKLGNISINYTSDVKLSSGIEIVDKAKKYVKEISSSINKLPESTISNKNKPIDDQITNPGLNTLRNSMDLSQSKINSRKTNESDESENLICEYYLNQSEKVNVSKASAALNIAPEEVERTILKLASQGNIKINKLIEA